MVLKHVMLTGLKQFIKKFPLGVSQKLGKWYEVRGDSMVWIKNLFKKSPWGPHKNWECICAVPWSVRKFFRKSPLGVSQKLGKKMCGLMVWKKIPFVGFKEIGKALMGFEQAPLMVSISLSWNRLCFCLRLHGSELSFSAITMLINLTPLSSSSSWWSS